MADDVLAKRDANRQNRENWKQLNPSSMAMRYQRGLKEIQSTRRVVEEEPEVDKPRSGYRKFEPSQPTRQRLLISGKPNMGKTTSLTTFDKQVAIVVAPGEQGTGSLTDSEGIHCFQMHHEAGDYLDTVEVMLSFQSLIYDLIDSGSYTTIAIDGMTKVHENFLNIASDGAKFAGVAYDNRVHGLAHDMFKAFVGELFYAATPMMVYTCWCDLEPMDMDLSATQKQAKMVMPAFSGRMAMDVLGLLNTGAVHAEINALCDQPGCPRQGRKKEEHHVWQLAPDPVHNANGDCGLKLPRHGLKLPTYIHQDYQILKSLINQVWADVKKRRG